ncbi:hypothetical protein J6590_080922 [Homalodisca vitripennis]|nr:hypothetical protein J6590_080922 [Homalodisca vitripennis]
MFHIKGLEWIITALNLSEELAQQAINNQDTLPCRAEPCSIFSRVFILFCLSLYKSDIIGDFHQDLKTTEHDICENLHYGTPFTMIDKKQCSDRQ